jgi:hypothetical protein
MNYRDMPVELLNWPGNKWEDIWKVLIGFKRFKQPRERKHDIVQASGQGTLT